MIVNKLHWKHRHFQWSERVVVFLLHRFYIPRPGLYLKFLRRHYLDSLLQFFGSKANASPRHIQPQILVFLDVTLQRIALIAISHVVLGILVDDVIQLIEFRLEDLLLLLLHFVQLLIVLHSLLGSLPKLVQVLLFLVGLLLPGKWEHGWLVLFGSAFR